MFCTKCGTKNADEARFCTECGTAVASPPSSFTDTAPHTAAVTSNAAVDISDAPFSPPPVPAETAPVPGGTLQNTDINPSVSPISPQKPAYTLMSEEPVNSGVNAFAQQYDQPGGSPMTYSPSNPPGGGNSPPQSPPGGQMPPVNAAGQGGSKAASYGGLPFTPPHVNAPPYGNQQQYTQKKSGNKTALIVVIIVVAVIILAVAAVWFFTDDILPWDKSVSVSTAAPPREQEDRGDTPPGATPVPAATRPPESPASAVPSASAAPSTASAVPQTEQIPDGGGSVTVADNTEFAFTPDTSGNWEIYTSDADNCDPLLTVYDDNNVTIAADDDSAGGGNASVTVELEEGVTYTVSARFFGNDPGRGDYTLTAVYTEGAEGAADELILPAEGGEIRVEEETTWLFTPGRTFLWVLRTSDNGGYDPELTLYDEAGAVIRNDDDGVGDKNALIFMDLEEGVTYRIKAGFYESGSGAYTLTVSQAIELPEEGGQVTVNDDSIYLFSPGSTGTWDFRTTSTGDNDPKLSIYDSITENEVVSDDDSAGGNDASVSIEALAGDVYIIYVWFYNYDASCTLDVRYYASSL